MITYTHIFVYVYTYICIYNFGKDYFSVLIYRTNEPKPFHFLHGFSNPGEKIPHWQLTIGSIIKHWFILRRVLNGKRN